MPTGRHLRNARPCGFVGLRAQTLIIGDCQARGYGREGIVVDHLTGKALVKNISDRGDQAGTTRAQNDVHVLMAQLR